MGPGRTGIREGGRLSARRLERAGGSRRCGRDVRCAALPDGSSRGARGPDVPGRRGGVRFGRGVDRRGHEGSVWAERWRSRGGSGPRERGSTGGASHRRRAALRARPGPRRGRSSGPALASEPRQARAPTWQVVGARAGEQVVGRREPRRGRTPGSALASSWQARPEGRSSGLPSERSEGETDWRAPPPGKVTDRASATLEPPKVAGRQGGMDRFEGARSGAPARVRRANRAARLQVYPYASMRF